MQAPVPSHDGSGRPDGAAVVELQGVSVIYGRQMALRDVSAAFPAGAVGLLGPNGAGKSTMLKALLGFVVPSQGRMRVLGLDVATSALDIRARLGYMPESDAHIPGMSAVAFVAYCGQLAGLPPADAMQTMREEILQRFDMESHAFFATARLWDDGIIDPRDTRRVLATALAVCRDAEVRQLNPNTFGVGRM